tara:strand:- start:204 stop:779 length:576 start_codon:yes stop_codon:yes gene_type:complete
MKFTRRNFLLGTASSTALIKMWGALNVAEAKIVAGSSNKERKLLDKMVRTLYPHNTFPNGPYDRTTEDVINKGNADAGKMLMMRDGLRDLEKNSFGDLSFNEATKYLKSIEGSPFFNHVRGTSVVTLYNDKEVWDVLGYEGASFDKGGYVNRGFNDLDWLPEPRIEEHPDHANFFVATQNKLAAKQTNANQ